MRIIYHHRTQGTGAEGVHISQVVKGLRDLEHTVVVASPNDQEPSATAGDNPFADKRGQRRRWLHRLARNVPQWAFEGLELGYNAAAYAKLAPLIATKPDLLYERHSFFTATGAYLASRFDVPYFVEVNEIAGQARVRDQVFVRAAQKIERYVFQRADAVIVVSPFLKEQIARQGVDPEKIHVLQNGVDDTQFVPGVGRDAVRQRLGVAPETLIVGFVGWFVAWHDLPMLLTAFAKALDGSDAILLLVGDGTLKSELKERAKRLGIEDRLLMPGAASYQQIPSYVDAMDVCVIPDSNQYRSPIKLFEYMAMGKPVVAPKYRPIQDVVEDERTGLLFEAKDQAALESQFKRLQAEPALRKGVGEAARRQVLERHLWRHVAERIVSLSNGAAR